MMHLKEITIILLNTLPVAEFRSTQNLPQMRMQLRVGSIKREGDLTHLHTTYSLTIITNSYRVLVLVLLLNNSLCI